MDCSNFIIILRVSISIFLYIDRLHIQYIDSRYYVQAVLQSFLCRFINRLNRKFCMSEGMFHEWTDRKLIQKWTHILTTINTLTRGERHEMLNRAFSEGILEIYRQTLLFPSISQVNNFRMELELRYGHDVRSRKGHEIIFTTEQLLKSSPVCTESFVDENRQCERTCINSCLS